MDDPRPRRHDGQAAMNASGFLVYLYKYKSEAYFAPQRLKLKGFVHDRFTR
jgi:hypothetical protein